MIGSTVHSLLLKRSNEMKNHLSFLMPLRKAASVTALALVVCMLLTSHPKVKKIMYSRDLWIS